MSCDDPCSCEKFVTDYYSVLGDKKNVEESEMKEANFFVNDNPHADPSNVLAGSNDWHYCAEARGIKRKEETIVRSLPLTLTEIFFGGLKKMKIERLGFANARETKTAIEKKIFTIAIKPGLKTGTKILFPEAGDRGPSKIPADIMFVTEDRPHETFKREGANLSMTVNIFLREALVGTVVTVNTVDERILRVPLTSIVTPDYEKFVTGEGLPLPDNPDQRGDLVIRFDVEYPVYLPLASKDYVKKAFKTPKTVKKFESSARDSRSIIEKMPRNVDDDIPIRRHRNDQLEKSKLCTN